MTKHWTDNVDQMDWDVYDKDESLACGYLVTAGALYCRGCGGGGLDLETRETCEECKGYGESM